MILIEAEAILKKGHKIATETLALVNSIRTNRGITAQTSLTLDNLLDERGRALYWEVWKRQDSIHFEQVLKYLAGKTS